MFETFCLRLAAGLVLALLVLPAGVVQPRFYRIHLLIVLGLTVAAGMAVRETVADLFWVALGLAGAACVAGNWCWALAGAPGGQASLWISAAALTACLASLSLGPETAPAGVWPIVNDLTAAGLLGMAVTAMLMGHWYLIAPTLSLEPLLRLLAALAGATGLRLLVAALGLWAGMSAATMTDDPAALLWLGVRWGAGFVGILVLTWMAWQAARIRSTQSATGILYVVVIFAFLGELTDQLLQTALQAGGP